MRNKDYRKYVERALNILEIFGESSRPITLIEVANLAKLTKATTMEQMRESGYAMSAQEEQTMDLCSIAAPLVNEQKKTVAAINVSLDVIGRKNCGIFKRQGRS